MSRRSCTRCPPPRAWPRWPASPTRRRATRSPTRVKITGAKAHAAGPTPSTASGAASRCARSSAALLGPLRRARRPDARGPGRRHPAASATPRPLRRVLGGVPISARSTASRHAAAPRHAQAADEYRAAAGRPREPATRPATSATATAPRAPTGHRRRARRPRATTATPSRRSPPSTCPHCARTPWPPPQSRPPPRPRPRPQEEAAVAEAAAEVEEAAAPWAAAPAERSAAAVGRPGLRR